MHTFVTLSTVLLFCIAASLAIDCPTSPGKWCETRETAHACGVGGEYETKFQ